MKSERKAQSQLQDTVGSYQNKEVSLNEEEVNELVEREAIKGTPFLIIGNIVDGYFLAFGKYRVSNVYNEKEEVLAFLATDTWNIIIKLIAIILEFDKEALKAEQ